MEMAGKDAVEIQRQRQQASVSVLTSHSRANDSRWVKENTSPQKSKHYIHNYSCYRCGENHAASNTLCKHYSTLCNFCHMTFEKHV